MRTLRHERARGKQKLRRGPYTLADRSRYHPNSVTIRTPLPLHHGVANTPPGHGGRVAPTPHGRRGGEASSSRNSFCHKELCIQPRRDRAAGPPIATGLTSKGRLCTQLLARMRFPRPGFGRYRVHRIGWLLLILFGLGWLACEVPLAAPKRSEALENPWRRTRHGWEEIGSLSTESRPHRPSLHPIVVALLELFLATAALIAFSVRKTRFPIPPFSGAATLPVPDGGTSWSAMVPRAAGCHGHACVAMRPGYSVSRDMPTTSVGMAPVFRNRSY